MHRFTVVLLPDLREGGFTVHFPAFPELVTQGESVEEALAMAHEALDLHVRGLAGDGEPVPVETKQPLVVVTAVDLDESASSEPALVDSSH